MSKKLFTIKKQNLPLRNLGIVYGELSIMYEGRLD